MTLESPALGPCLPIDAVETGLERFADVSGFIGNGYRPDHDAVGELMGLNRYSYVAGNPTNFVDPSGMILEIPFQDRCYQEDTDIRSGCKICWMMWEDIYQNEPDFGLNWPYYLGRFEHCLEKYNCPSECYTYPYCRKPVTQGNQGCGIVDTLANLVAVARELSFLPVVRRHNPWDRLTG
jgi:hypothetical protein